MILIYLELIWVLSFVDHNDHKSILSLEYLEEDQHKCCGILCHTLYKLITLVLLSHPFSNKSHTSCNLDTANHLCCRSSETIRQSRKDMMHGLEGNRNDFQYKTAEKNRHVIEMKRIQRSFLLILTFTSVPNGQQRVTYHLGCKRSR